MANPDILSAEYAADPTDCWKVLRHEHPLYFHEGMQAYVISRYEDVQMPFKDKGFTSDNYSWQLEPVHGRTILQMDGREHSVHRGLVMPAFRGTELTEKFVPVMQKNASELIDGFRHATEVDLVDQFTTRYPINVIVDMLALPKADHDLFHRWYNSIMAFLTNLAQDPDVHAAGLRPRTSSRSTCSRRSPSGGPTHATTCCRPCAPPRSTASR